MKYLLDKFKSIPLGEIVISVITICECETGIPGDTDPDKVRARLTHFLRLLVS
jgi:hypothetical protein